MKLTHFILLSALLHGLFIAIAYTRPIEIPEAQLEGWQDVELKPVTLQVLTPAPKPPVVEPQVVPEPVEEAPALEPEPPKAEAKPKAAPRAQRPSAPKREEPSLESSQSPIKPQAPQPAAAAKKLVTVVTTQADDAKQVAQEAKPDAPPQEAAGAIAANHLNVKPLDAPTQTNGRVDGSRQGIDQGSRESAYQGGTDDDGSILRGYKKAVFVAVNRQKSYPTLARRMKLEGKVFVELELDATGKILNARIKRSSGHEVLDQEALKSLLAMGKLPSPPPQIAGVARRLTIPLIYRLT